MEQTQSTNREIIGTGCFVAAGASIAVLLLGGSIYVLPFIFVYGLLALPFSFAGALIGKKVLQTRRGIWIGAIVAAVVEFGLLYANSSHLILSD